MSPKNWANVLLKGHCLTSWHLFFIRVYMRIWRSPDLLMEPKEVTLRMVTMQIYCKLNLTTPSKWFQPEVISGLSSRYLFLSSLFCCCCVLLHIPVCRWVLFLLHFLMLWNQPDFILGLRVVFCSFICVLKDNSRNTAYDYCFLPEMLLILLDTGQLRPWIN